MTRNLLIVLGLVLNLVSASVGLPPPPDRHAQICGTTLPRPASMTQAERTSVPPATCKKGTLHSVRLSWKASATFLSSPEDGSYTVYRWEQQGDTCQTAMVEREKTAYEDCDVEAGHTYRYTVTAVKGTRESDPTNVVEASVP